MQARGVEVDNSSLNRWVLKYTPALDQAFGQRKRLVGTNWRTATGLGLPRRPAPGRGVYAQRSMEILVLSGRQSRPNGLRPPDYQARAQSRVALSTQGHRPMWRAAEDHAR